MGGLVNVMEPCCSTGGGGGGAIVAADITDASVSGEAVLIGTPAEGRTALELGTLATQNGTFSGVSSGNNTGDQTNITGNAATVTTNANLTGHVTSAGNATALGSFTKAELSTAVSDSSPLYVGDATMAIGGAVTGGTAGRVPYLAAGPVLAHSAALAFDGTDLDLTGSIRFNGANNRITGVSNSLTFTAANQMLKLTNAYTAEFGLWGGGSANQFLIKGGTSPGNTNRPGTGITVSPGENIGNGNSSGVAAALGIKLHYAPLGASGSATIPTVLGAELTGAGNFVSYGQVSALTFKSTSYTVATLPAGVVATSAFVTDETTGVSHATAVGGGALERPVYYGNGQWRVG